MSIDEVATIIGRIADGFEDACRECLWDNSGKVYLCITEQLICGVDGNGDYLEPNYDNDPFFDEPGRWHGEQEKYKAWKRTIHPTNPGLLDLPPRPDNIPNLYIDGTFHSEIEPQPIEDGLHIDPGNRKGPAIVEKYGDKILLLSPTAVEYFNKKFMREAIANFFKDCGYR